MTKEELLDELTRLGYLRTPLLIEAFQAIDRKDFVLDDLRQDAYFNAPLPIGYGQTISQPLTVAFMLELLEPQPGQRILDVGSGSGWTTALLAYIVSKEGSTKHQAPNHKAGGRVFAIDRISELKQMGEENCSKYNFVKRGIATFIEADGSKGLAKEAPFDRILASATLDSEVPPAWKEELKISGRLVTPIGGSIFLLEKKSKKDFLVKEYPGFAFVPLIRDPPSP